MADDEIVAIVDEHNNIVDETPRHRMRHLRLIHRATYIFVFNAEGLVYLQKRTTSKDMYPGFYDAAAGGVVLSGESYEESALREVAEELGVTNTALHACFDFYYEDTDNRVWGSVFTCQYDGKFVHQPEEVDSGLFVSVHDLLIGKYYPVTPDTLEALRRLVAHDIPVS